MLVVNVILTISTHTIKKGMHFRDLMYSYRHNTTSVSPRQLSSVTKNLSHVTRKSANLPQW